ncbi:hypothetical protein E6C60_1361 [Paenibacillus algicola]|uniref:Uncharacterized protein n=1 Tax=Paenibacillus algicola TaxID=2565926 RepID=A0A4P8XHQ3_9BACL|nr:hypothetical protein [Paenibacillus algicola]QCT02077.1 hypothetical protein E6C60_1361 [Paenibacillus algicola]
MSLLWSIAAFFNRLWASQSHPTSTRICSLEDSVIKAMDRFMDYINKGIEWNVVFYIHEQIKLIHGILNVQMKPLLFKWLLDTSILPKGGFFVLPVFGGSSEGGDVSYAEHLVTTNEAIPQDPRS